MKERTLGPFRVPEIGLGCMNLSHAYDVPPPVEQAERVLLDAIEHGVRLFDTAALYGFGDNERLLGRVLREHRSRVVLATKGVIDGRPTAIRRNCEESLARLRVETIDLYYLHRVDLENRIPVEDSVGEMSRLAQEGKVRALGLSEVSAATLRRAHSVHPITAVQSEYSLWTRNPELGALDACRELGVAFVAFSPLGRGFLTGTQRDPSTLAKNDIRRRMPRFSAQCYPKNLGLLDTLSRLASELQCTEAQLAVAWVLSRGEHVIPIPGTTSPAHLVENLRASDVALDATHVARLDAAINERTVSGARYPAAVQVEIDTEEFR
jgi:aryl-alcohol dehydrogenase-like predicted oxidoreductase